jgi:hypothetical protein
MLLSLDAAKKYPGWSPDFVQRFSQDVLVCASRAFVCQPKWKDKEVVKGMDQAIIVKLKSDLRLHHRYMQDSFTSEKICKLADIATSGDNLITVINLCATYDGHSCAFGVYSPPGKSNRESASAKVLRTIDEVGFDDTTFLFNNSKKLSVGEKYERLFQNRVGGKLGLSRHRPVLSPALIRNPKNRTRPSNRS